MGTGYSLGCKKCGYEISGNLGVGFMFPLVYQETMEAAKAGKLGKTVKEFLEEHPDGTLNTGNAFLQCPECGDLKVGQDLSMYIRIPDVPRREQGRWSTAAPFPDAEYVSPGELEGEDTYRFHGYGNICEKCGKPMKPITIYDLDRRRYKEKSDQSDVPCPKCRELLWISVISMWD